MAASGPAGVMLLEGPVEIPDDGVGRGLPIFQGPYDGLLDPRPASIREGVDVPPGLELELQAQNGYGPVLLRARGKVSGLTALGGGESYPGLLGPAPL